MLHRQQRHTAEAVRIGPLNLGNLFVDLAASTHRCVFGKMVVPEQPGQHQCFEGDPILRLAALRTIHRVIKRALRCAEQQHVLAQ